MTNDQYLELHAVARKMLTLLDDAAGMLAMPDPSWTAEVEDFRDRLAALAPAEGNQDAVEAAVAAEQDRIIEAFLTTCSCGMTYNEWTGEPEQAQDCPTHGEPAAQYYARYYAHLVNADRARARIDEIDNPQQAPWGGFIPTDVNVPF
jgi:hypothetical protein